jgi:hypothetical protein
MLLLVGAAVDSCTLVPRVLLMPQGLLLVVVETKERHLR